MALLTHFLHKLTPKPEVSEHRPARGPEPASVKLLRPLLERRQLLRVELNGREYQTLLLAMDVERGLIWLDDLFPRAMTLEPGDELKVSYHREGQLISFSGPVVGWGGSLGFAGLALPLPQEVYSGPRRRWPRVEVYGWHPISAQLGVPGLSPLSGEVFNISGGGLRMGLTGDWRSFLRPQQILPLCEFTVAPGLRIRCRVKVCAFNLSHKPWRQTRVSLAFIDLEHSRQQALVSFIEHNLMNSACAARFSVSTLNF